MEANTKVRSEHLSKLAYVYLRQSSLGQVLNNRESTRRQRDLVETAKRLGWPASRIVLLDGDLGKSGRSSAERAAFKQMVGDVCVSDVGIVLGLEISRLARNGADFFPLLEMCSLTGTLIADEAGVYDPRDPNDHLMLGIKGVLSEAEIPVLYARLHGARWSRASRGELRRPIPAGYVWDELRRPVMDPDERVRSAVCAFFNRFDEEGSACAVARLYHREGLLFPRRSMGDHWDGPHRWKPLDVRHAAHVLQNPFYAGVYFYGRHRAITVLDPETRSRKTIIKRIPMKDWQVLIHGTHPAYISWERFLKNQERLKENRWMTGGNKGVTRSGAALLQGIVYCGRCGGRMGIRYSGHDTHPWYICKQMRQNGQTPYCQSVSGKRVDRFVEEQILEAVRPIGIEAAIEAVEELERRSEELKKQWEHRVAQADYEANLAKRRYEAVDPANRLVAGNLEKEWEERLVEVEDVRRAFADRRSRAPLRITGEEHNQLRELARDLPRLWQAKTTKQSDRKKIVRILMRDVWIDRDADPRRTRIRIHWQTGAVTEGQVERWSNLGKDNKTPNDVVRRLMELHSERKCPEEIARHLNDEGMKTAHGKPFTRNRVGSLLAWWRLTQRLDSSNRQEDKNTDPICGGKDDG